jgi:hypothetical protein
MVRRITFAVGLAISLLFAPHAAAVPVAPADLDAYGLGAPLGGVVVDSFTAALPPPPSIGTMENTVYFDGINYAYVHTVTPSLNNTFLFNTGFDVAGFTGIAGWSFADSLSAGGSGSGIDFQVQNLAGQLNWIATLGGSFGGWDAFEAITFFFVSTRPPTIGDYNLISTEAGTAQSLAPVPEPGSIALFGSGLVGLYAAMRRRRRSLKM